MSIGFQRCKALFVRAITAFGEGGPQSSCPGGLGHENNRRLDCCSRHDCRTGTAIALNVKSQPVTEEACVGLSCWPKTRQLNIGWAQRTTLASPSQPGLNERPESASQTSRVDRSRKSDRIIDVVPAAQPALPPEREPPSDELAVSPSRPHDDGTLGDARKSSRPSLELLLFATRIQVRELATSQNDHVNAKTTMMVNPATDGRWIEFK